MNLINDDAAQKPRNCHEMLEDVVAEMRGAKERCNGATALFSVWLDEWADRIEAAWRREKAVIEANALAAAEESSAAVDRFRDATKMISNMAAMREALQSIAAIYDGADTGGLDASIVIYNIVKAALSAPARNCDFLEFPRNEIDEQKIWDDYYKWCDNPRNRNIDNFPLHSVVGWLLAPAAERKGGSDGQ